MSFTWDDDFLNSVERELAKNMERAAIHLKNQIKQNLNVENPYWRGKGAKGVWYHGTEPSQPGEFPRKIRGDLIRSIAHEMEGTTAYVGSNLDYASFLELGTSKMAARPFLRATLDQEQEQIARIITGQA